MVTQGWINQIGAYRVEKKEGPRPGGAAYLKLRPGTPAFCIHTTEGSTVDGAVSTIRSRFTAPHFVVGQNRIVQMRPLWAQGATVHDWNDRYIQVECVGFSKLAEHQLTPDTWKPLVALTRWLHEQLGIPLRRPDGWADQLPAGTWANNNTRRQSRIALTFKGLVGHIDIPDQDPSWHWDPGSLDYSALIAEASGGDAKEEDDVKFDEFMMGAKKYMKRAKEKGKDAGPCPDKITGPQRFGWNLARFAYQNGGDLGLDEA